MHPLYPRTVADPIEAFSERVTALRGSLAPAYRGWSLARAIAHCAQSIECSMTHYPKLRSGLFRATIGPIVKRRFLRANAMSHDVTAPIAEISDAIALDEACDRALAAARAFAAFDGMLAPHLAYGWCTKPEYAELHWLHFEDHARKYAAS
jgi:Protein of unknown function (DUF1569)